MAEPTPGDWYLDRGRVWAPPRREGLKPVKIADVSPAFKGSDEIAANGRLLAAAKRLLAALEGVVRVADRATVEFDAARAAIRETKGG